MGLGGRLDATNIVEPLLSVITDIALDHQDYLGNTIAEITREKAGILRPNGILITLPQHPEANQAIGEAAATLNLPPSTPPTTSPATRLPSQPSFRPERSGVEKPASLPRSSEPCGCPGNHYTITLNGEPLRSTPRSPATTSSAISRWQSPLRSHYVTKTVTIKLKMTPHVTMTSYKITNSAIETGIRNTRWPGRLELIPSPKAPRSSST